MKRSGPEAHGPAPPRVGLVLGGGGILGGAWLVGALHALVEATGWEPRTADYIVGTSAGSVVAALVAEGVPPAFLAYHQRGGNVDGLTDALGRPVPAADEGSRRLLLWTGHLPRPVLGSPSLALRSLVRWWRYPPAAVLAAWAPRGFLDTREIRRIVEGVVPRGWSSHPHLWIVALDYTTGERVVFGRDDAPPADLWRAVEASCAIPGLYRPVEIADRLYVDGGVWSPSNLDVLAGCHLDLVIAMNPTSSLHPGVPTTLVERMERRLRRASGRRLGREARLLASEGTELLLVQPGPDDLEAMGVNLMDPSRRARVVDVAIETTAQRLLADDALEALSLLGRGGLARRR